ncbi:MAG: hypothetical protein NTY11_01505 [Candidatus Parcubacteria bacterium]|nr:hypothetical protein [Candidatus Parcubacteria bacterium]
MFQQVLRGTQCGERYLSAEIEELAEQEFEPQGFALALLVAARTCLEKTYGSGKSLGSLEGMALLFNILPKYVRALVSDETTVREILQGVKEQMVVVV